MNGIFLYHSDLYAKTLDMSGKLSLLSKKGGINASVNRSMAEEAVSLLLAIVDLVASSDPKDRSEFKGRVRVSCLKSLAFLDLLSRTGEIGRVLYASLVNDIDTVMKSLELS